MAIGRLGYDGCAILGQPNKVHCVSLKFILYWHISEKVLNTLVSEYRNCFNDLEWPLKMCEPSMPKSIV